MDKFLEAISQPYWWLSVVVVGVVINLFSGFLQKKMDAQMSRASTWWREKSEKEKAARRSKVARLKSDKHLQILMCFAEARHRQRAILLMVLSCSMVVAISFLSTLMRSLPQFKAMAAAGMGSASLMAMMGLLDLQSAIKCRSLLYEAVEVLKAEELPDV